MRFTKWYRATDIEELCPEGPGVFQVRAEALIEYPTGRSAMIYYGSSEQLRAELIKWTTAHERTGEELYRHATELGGVEPAQRCQRLLQRFHERFGALPQAQ